MQGTTIPPREKLEKRGVQGLSEVDLIAVLLGTGIDGHGVMSVARGVLRRLSKYVSDGGGDVAISWEELEEVKGLGKVKAMQIVSAIELGSRMIGKSQQGRPAVHCRDDVKAMFHSMRKSAQERVMVLALNARNEVLGKKTVALGSLNKAIVEPRDIFSWALEKRASGIILVHNHPSGDSRPSKADTLFTKRIREGGELLGVELVDHVIV